MRFKHFYLYIGLLIVFLSYDDIIAQKNTESFEQISLGFSYLNNFNRTDFHEFWEGNNALQVDLETPFYMGGLFLSGRYNSFSNLEEKLPSFKNYELSVGFGLSKDILENVSIGSSIGLLFSIFSFEELTEEQKRFAQEGFASDGLENEVGFLFSSYLKYSFTELWGVQIEVSRSITYTNKKIQLNYVGFGVYHVFKTPSFIEKILK
ncbi:MAG: hypothetical protein JXR11_00555 [Balneola sp.]